MANYSASLTAALAVGETQILSNAALTSPYSTQAVSVGREPGSSAELLVSNGSAQVATVQVAQDDVDAEYRPLVVDGTAVTVAAGDAGQFRCIGKFMRLSMAGDPGATTVSVTR